jgi:hypothetical protein
MFMEQSDCGFTHGAYIECKKNLVFNSYILWIDTTWILKAENKNLYNNSHFFGFKTQKRKICIQMLKIINYKEWKSISYLQPWKNIHLDVLIVHKFKELFHDPQSQVYILSQQCLFIFFVIWGKNDFNKPQRSPLGKNDCSFVVQPTTKLCILESIFLGLG